MTAQIPNLTQVPWNRPSLGEDEIAEVTDTIRSGWLTHGPKAAALEQAVRDELGVPDAFAVSSCTAALHLALLAAGIGDGDEVITPSLTFCAAPNALRQVGARPVFVDVEPATYNVCPEQAEAAITAATKAMVVMHYGGHPCDLAAFRDLADQHGLLLIEDAAHALLARRDGLRAGTVGDLAAFSFYANKVITTGEGGMLLGRRDLVQRARLLGRHGIDASVWQRHSGGRTAGYEVTVPGLKYVMSDLAAAVGLPQWRKLAAFTARRAEIAAAYTGALAGLPGLATPAVLPGVEPGWFLYSIFIDPAHAPLTREESAERLRTEYGIATSQHFRPVHTLQVHSGSVTCPLPVTETAAARQLSLPCYPAMTDDQVTQVITAVRALWGC
ncbi:spore coat polysaccharide biosynthesis protein SpsC [Microtetraspora sp. NBRC 13810]|uniref:DegT/DnrJ/EryC1/StrS family aminotransferase n=1 Tax=Microtetraspora sp. NBRC 13810 TaxID=3030990 RepID=UPI0024A4CD10|nr:DegT/DnrJ/EryC1/StrS family aminotransferase [Microtetraspora sp. NBRC 13810]GLW06241.1 spore coat polysaccharide biosynthesis protein SpsC [Microtetraspora sp. NBRC 13810]